MYSQKGYSIGGLSKVGSTWRVKWSGSEGVLLNHHRNTVPGRSDPSFNLSATPHAPLRALLEYRYVGTWTHLPPPADAVPAAAGAGAAAAGGAAVGLLDSPSNDVLLSFLLLLLPDLPCFRVCSFFSFFSRFSFDRLPPPPLPLLLCWLLLLLSATEPYDGLPPLPSPLRFFALPPPLLQRTR